MSLALSTLVIALFALMPGFFFESFLYSGKMARVRAGTQALTDLARSAGLSIPVHLLTLAILEATGLLRKVDFPLFTHALTGQFGQGNETLDALAVSLERDRVDIFLYLMATAAVGLMLGQVVQYAFLALPFINRLVLFRNRWYYTFFLPQGREPVVSCEAFVLTRSTLGNQTLLYSGEVSDFVSNSAEELNELYLRNAQRSLLKVAAGAPQPPGLGELLSRKVGAFLGAEEKGKAPEPEAEWRPLEQDLFVLRGDQIANLSLRYITAWRPVLILARVALTLSVGAVEGSTDLFGNSSRLRRFFLKCLPRPSGIFVIFADDEIPEAYVEVDGFRVTLTLDAPQKKEIRCQVVGTWRIAQKGMADQAGNLLFWLHNKAIGWWSGWIEERANTWRGPKPPEAPPAIGPGGS